MKVHFLIDERELCIDADEVEQSGDFLLARKDNRLVAGVRLDDCAAFWMEDIKDDTMSWLARYDGEEDDWVWYCDHCGNLSDIVLPYCPCCDRKADR